MTLSELDKAIRKHAQIEGAMMQNYISGEVRATWESLGRDLHYFKVMLTAKANQETAAQQTKTDRAPPSQEKRRRQSETMRKRWAEKKAALQAQKGE